MLRQLRQELGVPARILVLVLHPRRPGAVGLCHLGHAAGLDLRCRARDLLGELLPLVRLRAIPAAGDHQGAGPLGIGKTKMQHGKPAHRYADNVRLRDVERVQHCPDIVARPLLRVLLPVFWHIRRRIAACVVGDAAVPPREEAELRLVASVIAGELVDKQDRIPGPCLLVIEPDPVVCGEVRHRWFLLAPRSYVAPCRSGKPCALSRSLRHRAHQACFPYVRRGERLMQSDRDARIRERAYQIWIEEGCQHGKQDEYWYRAEQEIAAQEPEAEPADTPAEPGTRPRAPAKTPAAEKDAPAAPGRPRSRSKTTADERTSASGDNGPPRPPRPRARTRS